MTDTIDVAALVERELRERAAFMRAAGHDDDADLDEKAATALQSKADALAEARRENEALRGETFLASAEAAEHHRDNAIKMWDEERKLRTTAEASLATMREALEEIASRIETAVGAGVINTMPDQNYTQAAHRDAAIASVIDTARRALGGTNAE